MNSLTALPRPFFALAPMDDVTDTVFRQMVASCAVPDLFFTEFVNVDGLQSPGRAQLLKKLQHTTSETPLMVQLWGKSPDNFYTTARQLVDGTFAGELGLPTAAACAGIDLNMGCPDKTVVKHGACSALMQQRERADEIITATQEGASGKVPVSVKTRLGFNSIDLTWHEFLLKHHLAMLTIHGRTRKEMSKVPAHWEIIGQIRALRDEIAPGTLIIGNGDVASRQQGMDLARQYSLDGIMIGRGVFHDPFIFAKTSRWADYAAAQKLELFEQHLRLWLATWQPGSRAVAPLNKFCKVYINGFAGAKELRERLMRSRSAEELLELLNGSSIEVATQADVPVGV